MADHSKIEVGPAKLHFGDDDLGHTEGGVSVEFEWRNRDMVVDRYGESLVDMIRIGERATVRCRLGEWTLAGLGVAMPQMGQDTTNKYLYFGAEPGDRLGDNAAELYIRPYALSTSVNDIKFWKAVCQMDGPVEYNSDGDRVYPVVFHCLLDTTKADGKMLGRVYYDNAS